MNHCVEHEVIMRVACRRLADAKCAELRALMKQEINWDYLFATAQAHGLLPLLHKHLTTAASDLVPVYFLSRLKRESVANTQNVLHLLGKQRQVCRLLQEKDIGFAVFKGTLLADMAYGEISLRQAGDIDILISRERFAETRSCLESLDYQMFPPLTHAQLASHLNNHCEIQFVRDDWFTVVDLHWELAPRSFVYKVPAEEVLLRLQTATLGGTMVKTFSAEDSVLYQSMHGAKHLWRRLEWISALAESLRASPEISWDELIALAARAHATRMLSLGLRLVQALSDFDVPSHVLEAIDGDGAMQRMAQRVRAQLFTLSGAADSTETNLYNLRIMDRKRDALFSALRAIFTPTFPDWQALALPAPLYYAYRPLRLSKLYSTSLWRKFRHAASEERNA